MLLRAMVKTFAEAVMAAQADALCGAPYGQRSQKRTNQRKRVLAAGVGHQGGQSLEASIVASTRARSETTNSHPMSALPYQARPMVNDHLMSRRLARYQP
jgi:hypothetical protein